MPLSEKARIEVYIPALPQQTYQHLLDALAQEFTYTFGGSTIIRGLDGSYLSRLGVRMQDRVHLIYTDTPFAGEHVVFPRDSVVRTGYILPPSCSRDHRPTLHQGLGRRSTTTARAGHALQDRVW